MDTPVLIPVVVFILVHCVVLTLLQAHPSSKLKLRGLSPRANYTDRAAAAGRRS